MNLEEFLKQHLNNYNDSNTEIDNIIEILRNLFNGATDEEKQEIINIINLSNNQYISNYPKIKEIREWLDNRAND